MARKRCRAGGRLGREDGEEAEGMVEGAEDGGEEEEDGDMLPVSGCVEGGGEWG